MSATYDSVLKVAEEVYLPASARTWMEKPNVLLEGKSPTEVIAEGNGDEAMSLISALAEGQFA